MIDTTNITRLTGRATRPRRPEHEQPTGSAETFPPSADILPPPRGPFEHEDVSDIFGIWSSVLMGRSSTVICVRMEAHTSAVLLRTVDAWSVSCTFLPWSSLASRNFKRNCKAPTSSVPHATTLPTSVGRKETRNRIRYVGLHLPPTIKSNYVARHS